jgi:hypothetical protein
MESPYRITRLSPPERECIHFYYDVCPESPDGRQVVYFRFAGAVPGPGDVMVADRDGANARPVLAIASDVDRHSAARQLWVDNDTIACCPGNEGQLNTTLVSVRDGTRREVRGALRMVSPTAPLGLTTLHDFTKLAARKDDAVCLMDLRSGGLRPLFTVADALKVHPLGPAFPGDDQVMFMHTKWSPRGTRFFVMAANIYRVANETNANRINSIFVAEADGSGLRYLCEEFHHPIWSADDDHVLSFRPGASGGTLGMKWWGGYQDLVSVPVGGEDAAILFSGLAGKHLIVSPDGRRVAADATNWPQQGQGAIIVYEVGGAAPLPVLQMAQADFSQRGCHIHPTWSRDGARLYFNSMEGGRRAFYALDLRTEPV